MKNVVNAAMVLIGTFIGAGFASGQEVLQYFGVFGKYGVLGVVISCFLIGLFTYCTADNIVYLGGKEYVERICKYKWVNWLLNLYMLVMSATMITAFGECLNQVFGFPKIYGVILINAVTIIILYFGANGVVKLNAIATPLIIAGIIFALAANNTVSVFSNNNFATSAVVYTSYNVITLPFVMVGMRDMLKSKKSMLLCSAIFSGTIFILALCLLKLLKVADASVSIPLLDVVFENYVYILIFVLAMSMLTTAVSNGYGFLNAIGFSKNILLFFLSLFAVVFSLFSFNFIVKYLYSFFGYMGLYILFVNFYIFVKNREKPRKIKITNYK